MPRDGSDDYSKASGTTAVPATTVASTQFNSAIDDLVTDLNTIRPVKHGGTGVSSLSALATALGTTDATGNETISGDWIFTGTKLTVDANVPRFILKDADGTTTHNILRWANNNDNLLLQVLDNAETVVATSYEMNLDSLGATDHIFRVGPSNRLTLNSTGAVVVGTATADVLSADTVAGDMRASTAEAEAGTVHDKVMTPNRTAAAIAALAPDTGIGKSQTATDVSGSRSTATAYQNTTGQPIMVAVTMTVANNEYFEISTTGAFAGEELIIGEFNGSSFDHTISWIVQDDEYYQITGGTVQRWVELR